MESHGSSDGKTKLPFVEERSVDSEHHLSDVRLADLEEHLITRHLAGRLINLFRQ